MRRVPVWLVLLGVVVLLAFVAVVTGSEDESSVPPAARSTAWWAGPSVGGRGLYEQQLSVFYGDCDPGGGEGGCAPPVQIQTATTCGRNPIALDGGDAGQLRRLPGGAILVDDGSDLDVGTGRRTLSIFADTRASALEALRGLRPRSTRDPVATLPPPVYPRAVLGELRRVVVQRRRTPSIAATARALGRSPGAIALRLRLIALLPRNALDGVPVPRLSAAEVDRRRQAVLGANDGVRPEGVDAAPIERWRVSVRGLAGGC